MGEWYKDLLLDPRWQEKRANILFRDKFTCTLCYDNRTTLAVHHTEYRGKPWEVPDDKLKTVCAHCHDVIHALPDYDVIMAEKSISLETGCWCIVAYTENEIIFLYLFLDTYRHEVITVFPNNLKAA